MESGVKNKNLGSLRHNLKTALNTLNVCTGVQRSQVAAQLELSHNILVQKNGLREESTAVHDSMTDSLDFIHALNTAVICIQQRLLP